MEQKKTTKETAIAKTERRINEILEERENGLMELTNIINKADEDIKAAATAEAEAVKTGDVDAYHKAKAAARYAADLKELTQRRSELLREKALISDEEYNELLNGIYSEFKLVIDSSLEQMKGLIDKSIALAESYREKIDKANYTITRLQRDVYKDADRPRQANGEVLYTNSTDKTIKDWRVYNLGIWAANHAVYKDLKAKEEQHE